MLQNCVTSVKAGFTAMTTTTDKRRRNARPSKYRPRTDAQKRRRREQWEARVEDRKARTQLDLEADLRARYDALETALRDRGEDGVHRRRHSTALDDITDDARRLAVLKARVERLESLWQINRRKRETRGKIIIGGALLAELIEATAAGDTGFLAALLDVLDRRVELARDRLTVRELLGDAPLPVSFGLKASDDAQNGPAAVLQDGPDFDVMVQSAMAEEPLLHPSQNGPDDADLDPIWERRA
jgi:hypothetical protein